MYGNPLSRSWVFSKQSDCPLCASSPLVGGGDPSPEVRGPICRIPWPRLRLLRRGASPGRLLRRDGAWASPRPLHGDSLGALWHTQADHSITLLSSLCLFGKTAPWALRSPPGGRSLSLGPRAGDPWPHWLSRSDKPPRLAPALPRPCPLALALSRSHSATHTEICTPARSTHALAQTS